MTSSSSPAGRAAAEEEEEEEEEEDDDEDEEDDSSVLELFPIWRQRSPLLGSKYCKIFPKNQKCGITRSNFIGIPRNS